MRQRQFFPFGVQELRLRTAGIRPINLPVTSRQIQVAQRYRDKTWIEDLKRFKDFTDLGDVYIKNPNDLAILGFYLQDTIDTQLMLHRTFHSEYNKEEYNAVAVWRTSAREKGLI